MQAWTNTTMSIKNIVVSATATEGIDIDFLELFLKCKRDSSFGSLNVKLSPSTLCQLFSNSKIIVIGGKTEEEARHVYGPIRRFRSSNRVHGPPYSEYRRLLQAHGENQLGPPRPKILSRILSRTLSRNPLP